MTHLGLGPTVYVVVMAVLTFRNVPAHIWPFANLCPQRGTFPMVPGCRIFCLCYRPGGAGRLLACPEDHRFNPEQERCTNDPEVCEEKKLCDPPALLEKAEDLLLKEMKTECDNTGMTYCANRWELVVCHPVWSHMLGVIECDRNGDGSYICNLMTDSCEKNRSALWENAGIDSLAFGTVSSEDCEVPGDDEYQEESSVYSTMCCPPTLCRTTVSEQTLASKASSTTQSTKPEEYDEATTTGTTALTSSGSTASSVSQPDESQDPCTNMGEWPDAECKAMGSWCLPDSETIVTCGKSKQVRQVRNCKTEFAKYGLEGACLPLVFGCAYWQRNPVPDSWVPGKSEHAADHQHEAFEGWFREHWCKTHGRRGVLCTPDGQSLAHCNEKLLVDSVFHCASVEPKELLKGCQFCEPGTAFCIYRPRADIADACGVPPEDDDHDAACGFFPRRGRGVPQIVLEPEDSFDDLCGLLDHLPNAECRRSGSWCLPDLETIVTCGKKRRMRQVRSCRQAFEKEGLNSSCYPLAFGCAFWPQKVTPGNWSPRSVESEEDDRRVESYGAWFSEHWCRSHGVRGLVCTPDGSSLAHCNESLMVDYMLNCESVKPERLLLGCQYCEPGTAFCIYRPRAELADSCGKPGPGDNHRAACGFFIRGRRRPPVVHARRGFTTPYSTTAILQVRRTFATGKELEVTKRSIL